MRWTILWFENQRKEWKDQRQRSVDENKKGHIAYAEKQVAKWEMFIREGKRGFREIMVD